MPQNDQIWPKIGIFGQFGPGHAGLFNALLWVGWWLWRAGCISQDTYLLYCLRRIKKQGINKQPKESERHEEPISRDYTTGKKFAAEEEKVTVSGGGEEGYRRRFTFYGLGGTTVRYKSGSSGSISGHQLLLVNATKPPPPLLR